MTNWPFVVFLPIAIAASKMTVELIIVGVGSALHIDPELGNLSGQKLIWNLKVYNFQIEFLNMVQSVHCNLEKL